ncbi:hypothetical protein [Mycobacterium intracellulare]|uniref:hypothetical protein n=1 Tax=Mycobacterium intracellulare TaxID=1767 RepID=UPI001925B814|nr:hypothetical protein [Mycobacterium intracellulare]
MIVTCAVSGGNVPGGAAARGVDEHAPTLAVITTIADALRNRFCTSAPHFISPPSRLRIRARSPPLDFGVGLPGAASGQLGQNNDIRLWHRGHGYRDVFVDNRFRLWVGDQPSSWSIARPLNEDNKIEELTV